MAFLQDAILGLGQRIGGYQAQPLPILGSTPHDSNAPPLPPPPPVQSTPRARAFVLHDQTENIPRFVVAPSRIIDDTQTCIDRIEQRIRSLHVFDKVIG